MAGRRCDQKPSNNDCHARNAAVLGDRGPGKVLERHREEDASPVRWETSFYCTFSEIFRLSMTPAFLGDILQLFSSTHCAFSVMIKIMILWNGYFKELASI